MPPPDSDVLASPQPRGLGGMLRGLDRFADGLFGYDVFIAYRRKDGEPYVRALDKALSARGYSCFVDFREYRPGEPLAAATRRHVGKATVLVVLGTPAILEKRDPDWVLLEIDTFLADKEGTAAKLVPIDFSGTLVNNKTTSPIAQRLSEDFFWQREDAAPALGVPTPAVVDAIIATIGAQRRDKRRLRFFRMLAAVFLVLALLSAALAAGVVVALKQSQQNLNASKQALSDVYMNEANRRLTTMELNGANAFAAAALAQVDRTDARRLILEQPAIETRTVYAAGQAWGVLALDYDAVRDRFVVGDSDGNLRLIDPENSRPPEILLKGLKDISSISVSPEGTYMAIGHDDGSAEMRRIDTLVGEPGSQTAEPGCPIRSLEPAPGLTPALHWLDDRKLLVVESAGLYLIDASSPCQSRVPTKLLESTGDNGGMAFDPRSGHLFLVDRQFIHRYHWHDGRLDEHAAPYKLPIPPGKVDRWQVYGLVWSASLDRLAVMVNDGIVLLFDENFTPAGTVDLKSLARGSSGFNIGRGMGISSDGRHIYVVEDDFVLDSFTFDAPDFPIFRLEFRLPGFGMIESGSGSIAAAGMGASEPKRADLSIVTGTRFGQTLLAHDLGDEKNAKYFGAMAVSPDGRSIAVSTEIRPNPDGTSTVEESDSYGVIQIIDTSSGKTRSFPTGIGAARWIEFDPTGKYVSVVSGSGIAIFTTDGSVVNRQDNILSFSPTGYENAAWYSDSSGIVLTNPWYGAAKFPVDPSLRLAVVPVPAKSGLGKLATLSRGRFAYLTPDGVAIWDTASNTATIQAIPNDAYVSDIAAAPDGTLYLASRSGMMVASTEGTFTIRALPPSSSAESVAVSDDGGRLVVNGNQIFDLQNNRVAAEPKVAGASFYRLAPDGSRLYVLTDTGSVFAVSLLALDESADELSAQIAAQVGMGQSDLTIALP